MIEGFGRYGRYYFVVLQPRWSFGCVCDVILRADVTRWGCCRPLDLQRIHFTQFSRIDSGLGCWRYSQGRIQDFSQGRAPSDEPALECY